MITNNSLLQKFKQLWLVENVVTIGYDCFLCSYMGTFSRHKRDFKEVLVLFNKLQNSTHVRFAILKIKGQIQKNPADMITRRLSIIEVETTLVG